MKKKLLSVSMLALAGVLGVASCKAGSNNYGIPYAGTINQHADIQAYLTLRSIRNILDKKATFDYGITAADEQGNVLKPIEGVDGDILFDHKTEEKSVYARNVPVTSKNWELFKDSTKVNSGITTKITGPTYKVWFDTYNANDTFLSTSYLPIVKKYAESLNLDLTIVSGDGTSEASVLDKFINLDNYDAYAINMVKTNSGGSYTDKIQGANKDKPIIFFNRQPSDSTTGELDMATLNFTPDTYYVGFDANQGGQAQGEMIVDYINDHENEIDRDGNGTIGYALAIGDSGHNDSIARTKGIREALGTWTGAAGAGDKKEGSVTTKSGKTFKIVELAAQEMKTNAGSTWDASTAGNAAGGWRSQFGDQLDMAVSNNDGMGMAIYTAICEPSYMVPVFGYDSNSDAVLAIDPGSVK